MFDSHYYIGLISGTSVDGIDSVIVDLNEERPHLIAAHTCPFPVPLREQVLGLCQGEPVPPQVIGSINIALGIEFAQAVNHLLERAGIPASNIIAIGSHGQTVWHEPDSEFPFTMQLGDPNTIVQHTGITTVADLRGRDMAAGGQGAPLAPLLHRNVFHSKLVNRAVVNIGGISNITWLPTDGNCLAFDSGPGNVLLDYWISEHQQKTYDRDGRWARSGEPQQELLDLLLSEKYFSRKLPKSTGRELFNGQWLEKKLAAISSALKPEDVQATLLAFTATSIANELNQYDSVNEVYICGGGAHNTALMTTLGNQLGNASLATTSELGIDPDWVEAVAFAWMAKMAMEEQPVDTQAFTGAAGPVQAGAVYRQPSTSNKAFRGIRS